MVFGGWVGTGKLKKERHSKPDIMVQLYSYCTTNCCCKCMTLVNYKLKFMHIFFRTAFCQTIQLHDQCMKQLKRTLRIGWLSESLDILLSVACDVHHSSATSRWENNRVILLEEREHGCVNGVRCAPHKNRTPFHQYRCGPWQFLRVGTLKKPRWHFKASHRDKPIHTHIPTEPYMFHVLVGIC